MSEILETSAILPPLGILSQVSPGSRAALTDGGEFISYVKGEAVVVQGEPTSHLFIVVDGELAVALHQPDQIVPLGYIHEGETVGEMSFLEGFEASAYVTAAVASKVWRISKDAFELFLNRSPEAGTELLKAIVILLSHRNRKGQERLVQELEEQ
ncbi:MAG: transcriptional regulator, Crp/Fnr family [Verrucomicrobiales bacterium]|nr:transcriptional regulator, Crp/Fnr family [Verrucomicrobiales bacterium]